MPPGSPLSVLSLQPPFLGCTVPPEVEKAWQPSRYSNAGSKDRPLGAHPAGSPYLTLEAAQKQGGLVDFVPAVGTSEMLAAGAVERTNG